jgi:4-hydroxy-2-oxoheptanedioate aldolase
MPEALPAAIAAGARMTATVLNLPGAGLAELLAEPFDLVWIDLEHGALGRRDAQEMIVGAQAAGTYALVRLPADAAGEMTAVLDAGVDGVVIADVDAPETAAAVVERLNHPPAGSRGWGPRRLALRGRHGDGAPPSPSLWVQIESGRGVERAGEIAAVAGIDVLCVGTADLSFSLGKPLELDDAALVEAVAAVRAAAAEAGLAFALAGALERAPRELIEGASILVHSTDAKLCAEAVDTAAAWMRGVLDAEGESTAR